MDQPAGGVAPEQGALRAAQHFHPVHIEQMEAQAAHGWAIDVIDIDCHRVLVGVREVVQADAAQEEVDLAGFGVGDGVVQPRRHGRQVGAAREAELRDLLAGECGHCDAHLLQALLPLLRRDDDFLQKAVAFRRLPSGGPLLSNQPAQGEHDDRDGLGASRHECRPALHVLHDFLVISIGQGSHNAQNQRICPTCILRERNSFQSIAMRTLPGSISRCHLAAFIPATGLAEADGT